MLGYCKTSLIKALKMFYDRHHNNVDKCEASEYNFDLAIV